jgi:hypothetical protein
MILSTASYFVYASKKPGSLGGMGGLASQIDKGRGRWERKKEKI